jgi:hypothetical protein
VTVDIERSERKSWKEMRVEGKKRFEVRRITKIESEDQPVREDGESFQNSGKISSGLMEAIIRGSESFLKDVRRLLSYLHRSLVVEEPELNLKLKINIIFPPVWMNPIPMSAFPSKGWQLTDHGR